MTKPILTLPNQPPKPPEHSNVHPAIWEALAKIISHHILKGTK
jgi:hypothetical protein